MCWRVVGAYEVTACQNFRGLIHHPVCLSDSLLFCLNNDLSVCLTVWLFSFKTRARGSDEGSFLHRARLYRLDHWSVCRKSRESKCMSVTERHKKRKITEDGNGVTEFRKQPELKQPAVRGGEVFVLTYFELLKRRLGVIIGCSVQFFVMREAWWWRNIFNQNPRALISGSAHTEYNLLLTYCWNVSLVHWCNSWSLFNTTYTDFSHFTDMLVMMSET